MSLGVLNNLNAVYAENNLNNTSNSLSTVLQQLSSGSKINSGADDAAGLSLVNGLQANQQALNQSKTNATEGVGLLQVADGALSQVTSLLNRAVTLATEASNGTLNSSQDTAANQEYQSILSEINNIGATTSFNQQQVFGSNTNIYTGDSSASGASINDLNIRSLSSSNVGDTGGVMSYNTGASGNNVFVDLSNQSKVGGGVATVNDTLNSSGTTSMTITTLSNTGTNVSNVITVGGSSGYGNTAQGMINAINGSGLGLTASFTTAAVAGSTGSIATDAGIMITGSVGAGSAPSQQSFSGVVAAADNTVSALAAETALGTAGAAAATATKAGSDIISGSISLQIGNNAASTVTAAQVASANSEASGTVTMKQVASYITANAGLGVTATIDSTTGALKLSATNSTASLKVVSNLTDNTLKTSTAGNETTAYTATSAYSDGISTGSVANNGIEDSNIGSANSVTLTAAANPTMGLSVPAVESFAFGSSTLSTGILTVKDGLSGSHSLILGSASAGTDTVAHLAATLNTLGTTGGGGGTSLGFTADVNAGTGALEINQILDATSGITSTSKVSANMQSTVTAGTAVAAGVANAAGTPTASITQASVTAAGGLTGTLTITDGQNNSETLHLGIAGTTDTLANLAKTINTMGTTGSAAGSSLGYTATTNASGDMEIYQTGTSYKASTGLVATSTQAVVMATSSNVGALAQTSGSSVATAGVSTTGGIATISYSDRGGQSLSGTDLTNQTNAQTALTSLNAAISDVAAQDGYIGAQINQLNAASSVLATQSENVQSAQNAVQATDYASAASNMSKYQILSQTGISALAQANSMQQEVTKLLQ